MDKFENSLDTLDNVCTLIVNFEIKPLHILNNDNVYLRSKKKKDIGTSMIIYLYICIQKLQFSTYIIMYLGKT